MTKSHLKQNQVSITGKSTRLSSTLLTVTLLFTVLSLSCTSASLRTPNSDYTNQITTTTQSSSPHGGAPGDGTGLPHGGAAGDGAGGKGVVCYDNNQIISVTMLDLYEGKTQENYTYDQLEKDSQKTDTQIVEEAAKVLKDSNMFDFEFKSFKKNGWFVHGEVIKSDGTKYSVSDQIIEFEKMLTHNFNNELGLNTQHPYTIYQNFKFRKNTQLMSTSDSFEIEYPDNCKIEQLGLYKNNILFINFNLYQRMNSLNKAGFILHEKIYSLLRAYSNEKNSIRARRIVAKLLKDKNPKESDFFVNIDKLLLNKKIIECESAESTIESAFESNNIAGSKVYLVEDQISIPTMKVKTQTRVYAIASVLNGVKVFDLEQYGSVMSSLESLFNKSKKDWSFSSTGRDNSSFGIEKEDTRFIGFGSNEQNKPFVKINVKKFTNGAPPFTETLVCENKIKIFKK